MSSVDVCWRRKHRGIGLGSWRGATRGWLTVLVWAHAAVVLVVLALQTWLGDVWWPTTLLLYGPRWIWAVPVPLLGVLALFLRPSLVPMVGVTGLVVLLPLMGYHARFGNGWRSSGDQTLVVLTLNTHGSSVAGAAFRGLLGRVRPDVVALQEWSGDERELFGDDRGWYLCRERELVLASRYPIGNAEALDLRAAGHDAIVSRCEMELPGGRVCFGNIHLDTPREGIEAVRYQGISGIPKMREKLADRWEAAREADDFLRAARLPLLVAGDFNLTSDSRIFRDLWSDLADAFARTGLGFGWTRWTRWHGARIDHVLSSAPWNPMSCFVEDDVGSDHRPVVAVLTRSAPSR